MAVIDSKKTYNNLKKKGFVDSINHSDDHKYLELYHQGKLILYTKISHGSKKDVGDFLIKQMPIRIRRHGQDAPMPEKPAPFVGIEHHPAKVATARRSVTAARRVLARDPE